MAKRIFDQDIAVVRERARIDDIVRDYVALKGAGAGSLKGLCPFHDEKTPSFTVTPARGFFYCFGCGEGGDVITFIQRHLNVSFMEAVQHLADRVGVQLRFQDDGVAGPPAGQRVRILQANQAAQEFYAAELTSADALVGRQFLDQRGFDRSAAEQFMVGFAPKSGRALGNHLRKQGFTDDVLKSAGLIRDGGRDFFVGRLLWPIRDSASSVLGFGARRIFDDDWMPAKYINTPETPVYKKSQVLYGLDLARRAIGKKAQAVVVEGYTDVMAAHLSGVETAVASCGTAFGEDHGRLLQRLMGNNDAFHGEVIFTFDGDAAGQAAALKVFKNDKNFVSQTYVAVEPGGLDPCDLRLQSGDAAVRELVARRIPLYRFVMNNVLASYDLDRVEGRIGAAREAATLLTSIRDASLVDGYLRELAGKVGMDVEDVRKEAKRASTNKRDVQPLGDDPAEREREVDDIVFPNPSDRNLQVERDTLKLMLQYPWLFDTAWNGCESTDFTHASYRLVFDQIRALGYQDGWPDCVRESVTSHGLAQLIIALSVERILADPDEDYVTEYTTRLRLLSVIGLIHELKSKLQRMDPNADPNGHAALFYELVELERTRAALHAGTV